MSQKTSSEKNLSPLDDHRGEIEDRLANPTLTKADIVRWLKQEYGIRSSRGSINRAQRRWGVEAVGQQFERPGKKVHGDMAEVISEPIEDLKSPEEIAEERGMNLDEWEIYDTIINEWQGQRADDKGLITQRQLKIKLHRIIPLDVIVPARLPGKLFTPTYKPVRDRPEMVVFVGDQQYPYNNPDLENAFLSWLNHYKPDRGLLMGDTIDLPDISRHPDNPEKDATVQECVDAGYVGMHRYMEAGENTYWEKLAGNHDERLRRLQIDKIRKAYGLRRGKMPEEVADDPVLTVPYLLRLDELGINYIDPDGDYEHAQANVSKYLAARHGWIARKGSGASALSTLEHLGYSVVVGHSHRQSIVHKGIHDINGHLTTLMACETGAMCQIEGGLGYTVAPDWQNGWATAMIWPDGKFRLELATYVDGVAYYRDQQFK